MAAYFIDYISSYSNTNKKGRELQQFISRYRQLLVKDQMSMDALKAEIEQEIERLNKAYPRAARRTPPTCAPGCAVICCKRILPCAASASRTPARFSSPPSTCRAASASAARPTTCGTCAPWPSRRWADTPVRTHRPPLPAACFVRRQAGRRTPCSETFHLSNQLNLS